jgi:hypothetical protein
LNAPKPALSLPKDLDIRTRETPGFATQPAFVALSWAKDLRLALVASE